MESKDVTKEEVSFFAEGILIGCSSHQEWLLPWWWEHYSRFNSYPVVMADFGVSSSMKEWWKGKGESFDLSFPLPFLSQKDQIDPALQAIWAQIWNGNFWPVRNFWFRKPLALVRSPFQKTIWLDMDCQIKGSLTSLFSSCENPAGVSCVRERWSEGYHREIGLIGPTESSFNSGVVAFRADSPVIQEWADRTLSQTNVFLGDQDILSYILNRRKDFTELSEDYNWGQKREKNPHAVVIHWSGIKKVALIGEALRDFLPVLHGQKKHKKR